jgi:hypothetical protein
MSYQTQIPQITAASFAANPAVINAKIVLSVTVKEITKILEPEIRYSGEIYAGEE